MSRTSFVFTLAMAMLWTAVGLGQQEVLTRLYGTGVHAYFAGETKEAYEYFNTAVEGGSRDPRVVFFRGLTFLQLGRPDEAAADFETAAALEMADTEGFFNVGRSLQRIQGRSRAKIELARSKARVIAAQQQLREQDRRYNRIREQEPRVLEPLPSEGGVGGPFTPNVPAPKPGDDSGAPPVVVQPKPDDGKPSTPDNKPPAKPSEPATNNKPTRPGGGDDNPFQPNPARPDAGAPAATNVKPGGPSSAGALGRALQRAFGGLIPQTPALPFGGGEPDFGPGGDVPDFGPGGPPRAVPGGAGGLPPVVPAGANPFKALEKPAPANDKPAPANAGGKPLGNPFEKTDNLFEKKPAANPIDK